MSKCGLGTGHLGDVSRKGVAGCYRTVISLRGAGYTLQLTEVHVQGQIPDKCNSSFHTGDAVVLMYSGRDRAAFDALPRRYEWAYLHDCRVRSPQSRTEGTQAIPSCVMADMRFCTEDTRTVTSAEGRALAQRLGCDYHEISDLTTTEDIDAAFNALFAKVRARFRIENLDEVPYELGGRWRGTMAGYYKNRIMNILRQKDSASEDSG